MPRSSSAPTSRNLYCCLGALTVSTQTVLSRQVVWKARRADVNKRCSYGQATSALRHKRLNMQQAGAQNTRFAGPESGLQIPHDMVTGATCCRGCNSAKRTFFDVLVLYHHIGGISCSYEAIVSDSASASHDLVRPKVNVLVRPGGCHPQIQPSKKPVGQAQNVIKNLVLAHMNDLDVSDSNTTSTSPNFQHP